MSGEDKAIGERLASIEANLKGVDRIEASLEKFRDEHSAWRTLHDKDHATLSERLTKVDHRSANDHMRINELEKQMNAKIDRVDAVSRVEFEPIRELLKRLDNHMSWGVKTVIALVMVTVIGGGALVAKPWERNHPPAAPAASQPQPAPAL